MSEVLSQSQIDALLQSMAGGAPPGGEAKEKKDKIQYRKYDFFSPRKFTKDKIKLLRSIYDNYSRIAASQMNSLLRTATDMEVITVEEQRFYEFNNALMDTDILTLVKISLPNNIKTLPLLIHIDPTLTVNMIDRMLGGSGEDNSVGSGYTYTPLESVLYEKIMTYLVNITKDAWSGYVRMESTIERVEHDPSMFHDIGVDETVVIVMMNMDMGRVSGKLNICIPGNLLADIFQMLDNRKNLDLSEDRNTDDTRKGIMTNIKESSLDVKAQLGKVGVSLDDVYNLQVGDVINMNKPKGSEVTLYVEDHPWFTGLLGVHKRNVAVKVVDSVKQATD